MVVLSGAGALCEVALTRGSFHARVKRQTVEAYTRGHYSGIRDLSQPLRPDLIKKAGE